jgi:PAS domain S-box-containing protein
MNYFDSAGRDATSALSRLLSESAMARAALNACGVPLAILDAGQPARPVAYVNPAFEAFFGWRASEALGRGLGALAFRGDEALVHRMFAESTQRRALKAWSRDGALRPVELTLGPVRSPEGRVTHWIAAFADRAELERLRAELDSLRTLAAAA